MRLDKFCILLSSLMLFTYIFTGCTAARQEVSPTLLANKIHTNQEPQEIINKDIFLNTIQKYDINLYNDPRIGEAFSEKEVLLKQQYIGQDNTYLVVWSNDLGFTSIFEIFEKKDSFWNPIYYNKFGMQINAIQIRDDILEGKPLIEVTHYTKGSQKVSLLCLDSKNISIVWEYITIKEDTNQEDSSKRTEIIYENNSYIIVPGYLKSSCINNNSPLIIVHNNSDISILEGTKILKSNTISKDNYFMWSEKAHQFVETRGP